MSVHCDRERLASAVRAPPQALKVVKGSADYPASDLLKLWLILRSGRSEAHSPTFSVRACPGRLPRAAELIK